MAHKQSKKTGEAVTYSQPFVAEIKKDGLTPRLVIQAKKFFFHQLNKFRDGERVTLMVTNHKLKRTLAQNAYYWGVYLPLIAEKTGEHDLDALHELFKGKFLTSGIRTVLGEKVRIKRSTTELGIGDFCRYILAIQQLTGVEAPPTENYGLGPLGVRDAEISTDEEVDG